MRDRRFCFHFLSFFLVFAAILFTGQKNAIAEAAGKDRLYYFNMDSDGNQGNLVLVETDGHWGLLDTGHRYASTIKDETGRTISVPQSAGLSSQITMRSGKDVAKYMINRLGVTHLDFIVGTHAHSDHIGGVPEIANTSFKDSSGRTRYLVDSNTTYYYKDYQHISNFEDDLSTYSSSSWHNQAFAYQAEKTMAARGANMVDVSRSQAIHGDPGNAFGDYVTFEVGGMNFRLYNVHEYTDTGDENVNSIVTVMTNGDYTVVNLADINTNKGAIDKTSKAIAKDYADIDVVVAGHHGYAGSNTKTMFDALQPDFVVISNGEAEDSWLYTDSDLAAAIPYARSLFGTSFYSTGISPYAVVTDLSGKQVFVYKLQGNGKLTDAFYQSIKSTKKSGWVSWVNTGKTLWSYLENGTPKKNTWQKVDGKMYHFDSTGIMDTGWLADGKETHFMDENGALVTGWRMIAGKWYYFEPKYGNQLKNCWQKIDGVMYFFDADGVMQTGWVDDGGQTHYMNPSGGLVTGWQEINGHRYYFEPQYGNLAKNSWQKIDGKMYYFGADGAIQTGILQDGGETHFMDDSGALVTGWREIDGSWYYFEKSYGNALKKCWQKIDGKMYFFDADGKMHTGWLDDGSGETHYMGPDGALVTGWQEIDGKPYYFEPQFGNLQKQSGWVRIDGKMRFFDKDGNLVTGWLKDGGEIHYMDAQGALVTGWRQVDGKWYYFEPNYGNALKKCWQKIDGKMYYFDADGSMHTGWLEDGGTHYMGEDGAMLTGWQWIDDKCYFFSYDYGNLARDTKVDGYYVNADGVWVP